MVSSQVLTPSPAADHPAETTTAKMAQAAAGATEEEPARELTPKQVRELRRLCRKTANRAQYDDRSVQVRQIASILAMGLPSLQLFAPGFVATGCALQTWLDQVLAEGANWRDERILLPEAVQELRDWDRLLQMYARRRFNVVDDDEPVPASSAVTTPARTPARTPAKAQAKTPISATKIRAFRPEHAVAAQAIREQKTPLRSTRSVPSSRFPSVTSPVSSASPGSAYTPVVATPDSTTRRIPRSVTPSTLPRPGLCTPVSPAPLSARTFTTPRPRLIPVSSVASSSSPAVFDGDSSDESDHETHQTGDISKRLPLGTLSINTIDAAANAGGVETSSRKLSNPECRKSTTRAAISDLADAMTKTSITDTFDKENMPGDSSFQSAKGRAGSGQSDRDWSSLRSPGDSMRSSSAKIRRRPSLVRQGSYKR